MNLTLNIDKRLNAVIDTSRCINCDSCGGSCPVGAVNELERKIEGALMPHTQKLLPSSEGCPLGIVPQVLASYVSSGRIQAAADYLYSKNPLAAVCSQVCEQYCKMNDRWNFIGGTPVNIRAIERFVTDKIPSDDQRYKIRYSEKIAIVGGGPAGIMAAYTLAKRGYPVTIFEKDDTLGGSMNWAIPGFRVDKDLMDAEIGKIISGGIKLRTAIRLTDEDSEGTISWQSLTSQYDAVILAVGASKGEVLNIEGGTDEVTGEKTAGITDGVSLLREINLSPEHEPEGLGKRVIVIGGGRFAVDVSRTLARKGRKVTCVSMDEPENVRIAKETLERMAAENITFIAQSAPKRVLKEDGRITAVEFGKLRYQQTPEGAKAPVISGSELFKIPCDSLVFAVGRVFDISDLTKLRTYDDGAVKTDKYHRTSERGVFACGDITGASNSVVGAMTSARSAAEAVDWILRMRVRPLRRAKLMMGSEQLISQDEIKMARPAREEKILSNRSEMTKEPAEDMNAIIRKAGIEDTMPLLVDSKAAQDNGQNLTKVAVIGGGMAGIAAAIQLAKAGYAPSIFEKSPKLGGRYRWLATDRRIDCADFDEQMDKLAESGIKVIYNAAAGLKPSISELKAAGYKAILFAVGETRAVRADIPGAYAHGAFEITSLASRLSRELLVSGIGRQVVVCGSDEMAVDVARKLREYADDVTLVSRRSRGEILSRTSALEDALEEGVNLITGAQPVAAKEAAGMVSGVDIYIEARDVTINVPCDTLVLGDSQSAETDAIIARNPPLKKDESGHIITDCMLRTPIHGVLSVGGYDMPSVNAGWAGAAAVDNFLRGIDVPMNIIENTVANVTAPYEVISGKTPAQMGFEVGTMPLTAKQARREAGRYINVGYHKIDSSRCIGCGICAEVCLENAIDLVPCREVR